MTDFRAIIMYNQSHPEVTGSGGGTSVVNVLYVQPSRYFQRALDSGTGGYVYWMTVGSPDPNPNASTTSPNYTGVLSAYSIVGILSQ